MAAVYPSTIKNFIQKVDNTDPVVANDVNVVYDEVTSIQTVIGALPTASSWSGSFNQVTSDWVTVSGRIQNIEYGLNEAYNNFTDKRGGSTITPSSATVIGVTIKAASGQTANLTNWRNSSNTVVTSVTKDGWIAAIDGGDAA
jgi:hypothetical protein